MAPTGTCRLYRPDPTRVGATEQWRWAQASATMNADSVVVTVTGEIDASNCAELAGYVERHVGVAGTLVLDLSAVAFFATTGLACLRRIDLCCDRIRWTLVPSPAVRRVLRACHAQDLPQATSVAAAVRRLGHLSENHVAELVAAQAQVRIKRINPDGLHQTPGYHHVTVVESGRTAYLAGQCPVAPDGSIPPADDLPAQLQLTISNCLTVLAGIGAKPEDVVRSVIYVVTDDQHELSSVWTALNDSALGPAFSSASTLLGVAQLGFPGQRIEVDLTAALATQLGNRRVPGPSPISSSVMTTQLPPAYFMRDGDAFVPTSMAKGPWGSSISGNFIGGILGYVIEREAADQELQPARLTVDLLRPAAMEPLRVRASTIRRGRRLTLVDGEITQSGTVVARASAVFLRKGEQPPGSIWTSPVAMPPMPPDADAQIDGMPLMVWAYGKDPDIAGRSFDLTQWQHDGPKFVWLRDVKPLIDDEPLTAFVRTAMAGDVASSLTHYGTEGLVFINADYTLTLSRLPEGPDLGLAALTHSSHAGVGTGTAVMFDHRGPIGTATATTLANPGFRPRSLG